MSNWADLVRSYTSSTGTGDLNLDGTRSGRVGIEDFLTAGQTFYYAILSGTEFEVGLGTFQTSPSRLVRTTVHSKLEGGVFTKSPGTPLDVSTSESDIICSFNSMAAENLTHDLAAPGPIGATTPSTINSTEVTAGNVVASGDAIIKAATAQILTLSGGNASNVGANLQMYGEGLAWDGNFVFRKGTDIAAFLDGTNKRLGLGAAPSYGLDIVNDSASNNNRGIRLGWNTTTHYSTITNGGSAGLTFYEYGGSKFAWYDGDTLTELMRLETATGNLGVGTDAPSSSFKLHVNGQAVVGNTSATPLGNYHTLLIGERDGGGGQASIGFNPNSTGAAGNHAMGIVFDDTADAMWFRDWGTTGGPKVMTIERAGNVGIGDEAPYYRLTVDGHIGAKTHVPHMYLASPSRTNEYFIGANISDVVDGGLIIGKGANLTSGTSFMSVLPSGNVGIGTTSPGYKLDVAGAGMFRTSGATGVLITASNDNPSFQMLDSSLSTDFKIQCASGSTYFDAFGSGSLVHRVSGGSTQVMVMKSTGVINMPNLPTSSAGLSTGDLWNDSGTLKIAA